MNDVLGISGQLIQILIGIVTLTGGVIRGIPEIQKTIKEWQRKTDKAEEKTREEAKVFGREVSAKYLDLSIILMCSAYFSLVSIDAVVISGRDPQAAFSFTATLIISILITMALIFLWYRHKAEIGIGWGAVITLVLLILAPGGVFFSAEEKNGVPGVNLWYSVPILSLLAMTMWIYEYGHPLDRTVSRLQRIKVIIAITFIVLISTVSLGKQYQYSVQNDRRGRTPSITSSEAKALLDATNKWTRAQKSNFYAALSDMYLIGNYFDLYQSIQNKAEGAETERKNYVMSKLAALELDLSEEDQATIANDIVNLLRNGGGEQDVNNYLISYLSNASALPEDLSETQFAALQRFASDVYYGQIYSTLLIIDITQAFDDFDDLPHEQQKVFLANRLKWIHATGGKDTNQSTIALPGITPESRFSAISPIMIDHALPLQSSKLRTLCLEFDYDPSISEKYCKPQTSTDLIINPFYSQNDIEISTVSIFPELEISSSTKEPLLEQLSFPRDYEAFLALREYSALSRDIFLETVEAGVLRDNIQQALEDFDALAPQTQVAFIYYLTNYKAVEGDNNVIRNSQDVYDVLVALNQAKVIPLDNEGNELDESDARILSDMIKQGTDPNQLPRNALTNMARKILVIPSQDNQKKIRDLLRIEDPDIPIRDLLDVQIFRLIGFLDAELDSSQRDNFFDVISNPINIVMPHLLETKILFADKDFPANASTTEKLAFVTDAQEAFGKFTELDKNQQANLLHRLAISLYDAKGTYSHNIFGLMIAQANSWSALAGLVVASFLYLPFIILIVVLASYTATQLGARDRLYQLLFDESSQPDNWQFSVGTPDIIRGREEIIVQLKNLASRGWGAIAVVGRRGVGKTRILLEMLRQGRAADIPNAISAWISTPSRFEESELIESVLERLTANVENAISKYLGAKPLEIRRFEMNTTIVGITVYILSWIALGATFLIMSDRVSSDISVTGSWFPIFLVSLMSVVALCVHLFNTQPTDLSAWLERDRSSSPHTVLLYRDAKRVLRFLENRKKLSVKDTGETSFGVNFFYWVGIVASVMAFLFAVVDGINSPSSRPIDIGLAIVSAFVVRGLLFSLFNSRRPVTQGFSLLSLVAEYRGFIDRAVFRVRHGALGPRNNDEFEIVVCIDELDKIIVPSELLAYLRRMKVIFEIPGAYYFLSISEDAMRALYLGAAEGKNEVDSTFDHIIRIPPANCDLGEQIARAYLNKHSNAPRDARIDRTIAAISYGIPRDIIRRCDEILAKDNIADLKPASISDTFRELQVNIAYSERLLTREQTRDFSGDAQDAVQSLSTFFNGSSIEENKSIAILLSLWVLSLISIITTLKEGNWQTYLETARDIGYRILEEQPGILIEQLNELQRKVMAERTN